MQSAVPPRPPSHITRKLRYPDFLGIGVQKCGTSWLDNNLRDHQELWLPPIKELHYFDSLHLPASQRDAGAWRRAFVRDSYLWHFENTPTARWDYDRFGQLAHIAGEPVDDAWYGSIFAQAGPWQLCGEITPDYALLSDRAIRHVLDLSPEIRILINLRDPIDRDWSEIRMAALENGRSEPEDLLAISRQPDVLQRTDYVGLVTRWLAHVPGDRIKIIFLDDIEQQPLAVMKDICCFLGISDCGIAVPDLRQTINAGVEQPMPGSLYAELKERHRDRYQELQVLFPDRARVWAARHYG
jgi:hypothetical protein